VFDWNQAMSLHVDGRQALFEDNVANQRLEIATGRLHFDESHLVENWAEAFYLNPHGPAHFGANEFLSRRFNVDFNAGSQHAKSMLPGSWQDHQRGARVYQSIATQTFRDI
jgi:hypothetical protein